MYGDAKVTITPIQLTNERPNRQEQSLRNEGKQQALSDMYKEAEELIDFVEKLYGQPLKNYQKEAFKAFYTAKTQYPIYRPNRGLVK
jgi:hypothetical protein